MSEAWSEGYFTDVGYTHGYYREISPVFLRFCLLIRGFAVSENSQPAHCELGFGQGVSINIHAATNEGIWFGNDFTPAHAAFANELANASDSGANLTDDSFQDMLTRNDLPQFDSITLHGIWTWVNPSNHQTIAAFAKKFLKPGGMLYVSYNCFPGWSAHAPLRHLFAVHNRFAGEPTTPVKRIDNAMAFARNLLAAKPVYAKAVPGVEQRLEKVAEQNRQYLAHEYFNREWNCMYFSDVVSALEAAKVEYACSASPLDSVDVINLSEEGINFLQQIENPILKEQIRDYFVNQQFRKDIYLRGAQRISLTEQRERLFGQRFLLLQHPEDVSMKANGAAGEIQLHQELYKPLVEHLASGSYAPKSIRQLLDLMPQESYPKIVQAIVVLVGLGAVSPCQNETAAKKMKKTSDALNLYLCEQAQFSNKLNTLASPVMGCGTVVERINQLFLLAIHRKHKDLAESVWNVLRANGDVLLKDGKPIQDVEGNMAELGEKLTRFNEKLLPIYKAAGIA